MDNFRTHYANLQVAENASIEVIRGAYRYLAQKWHPDKHPHDRERAERIMRIINEAYAVLSDPKRRQEHDEWIRRQRESRSTWPPHEDAQQDQAESRTYAEDTATADGDWAPAKKSTEDIDKKYHPWRRYFARSVDTLTSGLGVFFLVVVFAYSEWPELMVSVEPWLDNEFVVAILILALWIPVEAVFISTISTTPAKSIFGIRVEKPDGSKLLYREAFVRSVMVWVQGLGLGIPIVTLFANGFAYKRLADTGTTLWDSAANSVVVHKKWGFFRALIATLATFLTFVIIAVIGAESQRSVQNTYLADYDDQTDTGYGFVFSNNCDKPVSLAIRYSDTDGNWHTVGWWDFSPYTSQHLAFEDGTAVRTAISVWYYYAETSDGSIQSWRGEHNFEYQGVTLPMIEMEDSDGDSEWSVTCLD